MILWLNTVYLHFIFPSQNVILSFLYLGFIAKRIYQNNMVGIPHLIEFIVTT